MRPRRVFQPTFDLMPSRIAPSVGVIASPMDPSSTPDGSPLNITSPMDPSSNPAGPTDDPTAAGPGSFTPVNAGSTMAC